MLHVTVSSFCLAGSMSCFKKEDNDEDSGNNDAIQLHHDKCKLLLCYPVYATNVSPIYPSSNFIQAAYFTED